MNILSHLPHDMILAALKKSPGNEIGTGKFESPASSAALAVNAFGYFMHPKSHTEEFPIDGAFAFLKSPVKSVCIEREMRFPWRGGRHPWLDVSVENSSWLLGIESKRFEPYRTKKAGEFAEIYLETEWGPEMEPYTALCRSLSTKRRRFVHLDAAQLVKHAFGIATQARKHSKKAALAYVYSEPRHWPNGKPIEQAAVQLHRHEIQQFSELVHGAQVRFDFLNYTSLLSSWERRGPNKLREHATLVRENFLIDQFS